MITEKKHRFERDFYRGEMTGAFTLCLSGKVEMFTEPHIVDLFKDILASVTIKSGCIVPIYCFMPDHQHLIVKGTAKDSDLWKFVVNYKQKTGFWMSNNRPGTKWQKDFYDHVIRKDEAIATQVRYVLDNPVRKGLVSSWQEYPFKGSIGCQLEVS